MYFVYVLKSQNNGKLYTGLTQNTEKRLKEHNSGWVKSTKPFIPYSMIYQEAHADRLSARKMEKYYKTAAGKRFLTKFALLFPAP